MLDEAQAIKNHLSRTSIACRALMADHRWALSGTPIQNSLDELYPYFKFLGVPHTGSFKIFKNNYTGGGDKRKAERLLVRLSQFMIRRTHGERMFGAPILKLPTAHQATFWCDFNTIERKIYDVVEKRFAERLQIEARTQKDKGYSNGLVMLLRLRQLTSHVLMLKLVMQDLLEREDLEQIKRLVNQTAADSRSNAGRTIIQLRKQLEQISIDEPSGAAADDELSPEEEGEDMWENVGDEAQTWPSSNRRKSGKGFGKTYDFGPQLKSLMTGPSWQKANTRVKCGHCKGDVTEVWVLSCDHMLCSDCYEYVIVAAAEEHEPQAACPICRHAFSNARREVLRLPENTRPATRSQSRREKRIVEIENEDLPREWLEFGNQPILPSAKTIAIKSQLLNWYAFSQGRVVGWCADERFQV